MAGFTGHAVTHKAIVERERALVDNAIADHIAEYQVIAWSSKFAADHRRYAAQCVGIITDLEARIAVRRFMRAFTGMAVDAAPFRRD